VLFIKTISVKVFDQKFSLFVVVLKFPEEKVCQKRRKTHFIIFSNIYLGKYLIFLFDFLGKFCINFEMFCWTFSEKWLGFFGLDFVLIFRELLNF
jgi:hypothetical protein